jgi:hypothetical protein
MPLVLHQAMAMPLTERCVITLLTIGKIGDGLMTGPNDAPKLRKKFELRKNCGRERTQKVPLMFRP